MDLHTQDISYSEYNLFVYLFYFKIEATLLSTISQYHGRVAATILKLVNPIHVQFLTNCEVFIRH